MQLSSLRPAVPSVSPRSSQGQEKLLLRRTLDRGALRSFSVWDRAEAKARPIKRAEIPDDSTPVLILHLWATWCIPCKEEFPLWRELGPRLRNQHKGRVHVVHVALQEEAASIDSFIRELNNQMPTGPLYIDLSEALAKNLSSFLSGGDVLLPVTMWLDPKRVVWKVIVGPVKKRGAEIVSATHQLIQIVNHEEETQLDNSLNPK